MRTLRTRVGMLAALVVVLGLAGTASATSISMIWISTSGPADGVGTSTLGAVTPANVGDTAVLEIRVSVTAPGLNAISVSYGYSTSVIDTPGGYIPGGLSGGDLIVCPSSVANPFGPGSCGRTTAAFGTVGVPSLLAENIGLSGTGGGTTSAAAIAGIAEGQTAGTFELAHITFTATGGGTTGVGFYRPGFDGGTTIAPPTLVFPTITSGSITVIPEPGTIGLLVLGLGALAFAGRRR